MALTTKKSFLKLNGGLLTTKLDSRSDLEKQNDGARQHENTIIEPYGNFRRRNGTEMVHPTKGGGEAYLWELQYDKSTGYLIEVGDEYMRFYRNGAQITKAVALSTASWAANIFTFTTTGDHGWVAGDYVTITGVTPTGYNLTSVPIYDVPSTSSFRVSLPLVSDPGAYSSGGSVAGPYEIVSPYAIEDVPDLQPRQANDIITITSLTYHPRLLRRLTTTTFDIVMETYKYPPFRDENITEISLDPTAVSGTSVTLAATAPAWVDATYYTVDRYVSSGGSIYKAIADHVADDGGGAGTDEGPGDNEPGVGEDWQDFWELQAVFTADNVGGYYRLGHRRVADSVKKLIWDQTTPASNLNGSSSELTVKGEWVFTTSGVWSGTIDVEREDPITGIWESVYQGNSGDGTRNLLYTGKEEDGAQYRITMSGWADVTAAGAGTNDAYAYLEVVDSIIYGFCRVTGYNSPVSVTVSVQDEFTKDTATTIWAEGSWSDRRGFPKGSDLYEQRKIYAGNIAEPLKVWGSQIGDFYNHLMDVAADNEAFQYAIPATQQDPIEWIIGGGAILIGTGKEYGNLSSGSDDLTITPSNVRYRVQEAKGFDPIKPRIVGPIFAGVERNGRRLREIAYQFDAGVSGGYKATDLNRLNDEISASGITSIAYVQLKEPYIICVFGDGTAGCLAYNREDNIVGWTKWTTNGLFESVATISGSENDEIWFVVKRTLNGVVRRFIERVRPTDWTSIENAFYVDCGLTQDYGMDVSTVTNLFHLANEEVAILGDGSPQANQTVDVNNATLLLQKAATKFQIGLAYDCKWQPFRLDQDPKFGGTQGHKKSIIDIWVRVRNTVGVTIESDENEYELPFNSTNDLMGVAVAPQTKQKRINWPSSYGLDIEDNDPKLVLKQTKPLPFEVLAVIVNYKIAPK